ncbi:hypothetical protein JOM56_005167 [Amanita muscaria]
MEPLFQTISTIIRPVAISRRAMEPLFQTIFTIIKPVAELPSQSHTIKSVAEPSSQSQSTEPVAEPSSQLQSAQPVAEPSSQSQKLPVAECRASRKKRPEPKLHQSESLFMGPLNTAYTGNFNIRLRETLDTGEPPKEEFHLEEERWTVHDSRTRLYDDLSTNSPTNFTFPSTASSDFFASSYHTLRVTSTGTQLISTDHRHSHIKARSTTPCEKTAE